MDVFDDELINFWSCLQRQGVKYIMIGGVATNLYGYPRTTDDNNVWIGDTLENRQKSRAALLAYSTIDYFMPDTLQIVPG